MNKISRRDYLTTDPCRLFKDYPKIGEMHSGMDADDAVFHGSDMDAPFRIPAGGEMRNVRAKKTFGFFSSIEVSFSSPRCYIPR